MPVARPPLHGIESIFCKAAMARSGSPRRAAIRARMSIDCGLFAASFSIGCKAMARSIKVKAAALSPRTSRDQREIIQKRPIVRLFFEKGFQFGAGFAPGFLSGGVIAGDFLCPA